MNNTWMVCLAVLVIACTEPAQNDQKETLTASAPEQGVENLDWLLGHWKRLNEEEGKETLEQWNKVDDAEYSGIGFTMQDGDTVKQERIRLIKRDGAWDLIVKAPEDVDPITFKGLSHTAHEFTCVNPDIDFPNTIHYWTQGENMNASVSNSDMEIAFEFEKVKN